MTGALVLVIAAVAAAALVLLLVGLREFRSDALEILHVDDLELLRKEQRRRARAMGLWRRSLGVRCPVCGDCSARVGSRGSSAGSTRRGVLVASRSTGSSRSAPRGVCSSHRWCSCSSSRATSSTCRCASPYRCCCRWGGSRALSASAGSGWTATSRTSSTCSLSRSWPA
ncbi:hypothetical protein NKG05_16740 [Oerskovia sp. M15]